MNEQPDILEVGPPGYPPGDYAIVEIMGHQTMVGRVTEVERFGAKLMAMELIFGGKLLPPTYQGGASIYRFTPCSAEVAFKNQARNDWQLPAPVRGILPAPMIGGPGDINDDDLEQFTDDDPRDDAMNDDPGM